MRALSILGRLCWKEWRQGWMLLALGAVLAPLAVKLTEAHVRLPYGLNPVTVIIYLLLFGIALWSPQLVAGGKSRQTYAGMHFSIPSAVPLLVTFFVQGLIVTLVGAMLGCWIAYLSNNIHNVSNIFVGALYFLTIYAVTTVVTRAISSAAGMASGIILVVVFGTLRFYDMLQQAISYRSLFENEYIYLLFCVVAGMLAFLLLSSTRRWFLTRRILAIPLLAAAVIGVPVYHQLRSRWANEGAPVFLMSSYSQSSPDGSVRVALVSDRSVLQRRSYQLVDYRTQRSITQRFATPVKPLGIIGRDTVIMLGQRSGEKRMTVYRWQMGDNSVRPLLSLPSRFSDLDGSVLSNDIVSIASISPDGRYVLLRTRSLVARTEWTGDLWLLDLDQAQVHLITAATQDYNATFSWMPGRVILSSYRNPLSITLPNGKASPLAIPTAREGTR